MSSRTPKIVLDLALLVDRGPAMQVLDRLGAVSK
jgi:hypothetical protein